MKAQRDETLIYSRLRIGNSQEIKGKLLITMSYDDGMMAACH